MILSVDDKRKEEIFSAPLVNMKAVCLHLLYSVCRQNALQHMKCHWVPIS